MQQNDKHIIGLCGRLMSGKTVLAKSICERNGGQIITVANELKKLVVGIDPDFFLSVEYLNQLKRENTLFRLSPSSYIIDYLSKETNIPYEFISNEWKERGTLYNAREVLQFIGTNIIRKFNPNWHVEKLKENIRKCESDWICVDDVRFPNEKEAVEEVGGETYFIVRPQSETMSNHESETSLRWQDFDSSHIIINDGGEEEMKDCFNEMLNKPSFFKGDCPVLLSANEYYTKHNTNFGLYESELVNEVISQNQSSEVFRKHGIIKYSNSYFLKRVKFSQEVLGSSHSVDYCRNKFILYNPLIYENLKFHIQ